MADRETSGIASVWAGAWFRALAGGVLWLGALLVIRPRPFDIAWAHALLLLSPMVLVPIGLELAAREAAGVWSKRVSKLIAAAQMPAALLLGLAYLLPQGRAAACLALPWLLTTALVALSGLLRVLGRRPKALDELCLDAGLIFVSVGGAWAVADRLGLRPLGFEPVIVLLTAIHFHYAGFALPIVTGLAVRQAGGGWAARLAGHGVVVGVPLVAAGITTTQLGRGQSVECVAAWWMALSGTLAAWLHLRLAAQAVWPVASRFLWAVSGLALFGSMALAAAYGSRAFAPVAWLDIPWMRALHGTANAVGFALAGLLAWGLAGRVLKEERSFRGANSTWMWGEKDSAQRHRGHGGSTEG